MTTLLAIKQRKKTIDTIFRASCAMKAAAVVRVRKVEKWIAEFAESKMLAKTYDQAVLSNLFARFSMNIGPRKRANILIGCSKGMCGDFLSNIKTYFKINKTNEEFWLLFGTKLEAQCTESRFVYFGDVALNEFDLFHTSAMLYNFIKENCITDLVIHHFSKDKIARRMIFSKDLVLDSFKENDSDQDINEEFALFLIMRELYSAMLESALEENRQRLAAMTQARTNAESMGKIIARLYHKARQEKITTELNEITSGNIK